MAAGVEDEDLMIACRDFRKITDSCNRTGFVEGMGAGKDEGLREGFTPGFASGVALSTPWGILKGRTRCCIAPDFSNDGRYLQSEDHTLVCASSASGALKVFCRRQPPPAGVGAPTSTIKHNLISNQLEELLELLHNSERTQEAAISERKEYGRTSTEVVDSSSSQIKEVPPYSAECSTSLTRKEEDDKRVEVMDVAATAAAAADICCSRTLHDLKPADMLDEFSSRLDAIEESLL